jgi:hypothetical protein
LRLLFLFRRLKSCKAGLRQTRLPGLVSSWFRVKLAPQTDVATANRVIDMHLAHLIAHISRTQHKRTNGVGESCVTSRHPSVFTMQNPGSVEMSAPQAVSGITRYAPWGFSALSRARIPSSGLSTIRCRNTLHKKAEVQPDASLLLARI